MGRHIMGKILAGGNLVSSAVFFLKSSIAAAFLSTSCTRSADRALSCLGKKKG